MRKLILFSVLFFMVGCASIDIPNFIEDENPYRQSFDSPFSEVFEVTKEAMTDAGWVISKESNPAVYDRSRSLSKDGGEQVLIFTDVRELGFAVGTRYARLNVYVVSTEENTTEVEVRYLTANSIGFKTFYNYKHDQSVKRLLYMIERKLDKTDVITSN